ncbi:MAG: uroporphyrinogen-III C-methyltransferase [Lawsonibacter sp.]|nr:uroporphyrinogen-III C-methyltransferase [Lawsonibacter sp.]
MKPGYVSLVGAGCGNADLITLRGLHRLQTCDAVVYDDLLDPALLEQAPQAEKFPMGKRAGRPSPTQEAICQTLIRLAREGKRVVRLKGGDPFVFGRGGEEALALQAAGIPWELVPGVSSAVAVPAAAGIPVTHRGVSRSFHVITAHTMEEEDLDRRLLQLACLEGTLVFLMGLRRLPQIAQGLMVGGMPPDTPAAVIYGAPSKAARGTLQTIPERASEATAPAVVVVGETAALDLRPSALEDWYKQCALQESV